MPITDWLLYLCWQVRQSCRDRFGLLGYRALWGQCRLLLQMGLAERLLRREYGRLHRTLTGVPISLTSQRHLQRLGHPYYHSRCRGGEGHLEVAKSLYANQAKLCHMILSLKPFGCMPSTQSDGVMSAVTTHHPELLFLPIETAGEGEINAYSRVQMALVEARRAARAEFARVLDNSGFNLAQVRAYLAEHPELNRAFYAFPKDKRFAGTAANFLSHIIGLMERRR
jgi:hypothetical protein